MTHEARNLQSARLALIGLLTTVGCIAVVAWAVTLWLADVAIDQTIYEGRSLVEDYSVGEQLADRRRDFYWTIVSWFVWIGYLAAVYWLVAWLIAAVRLRSDIRWFASPTLWLASALVIWVIMAFLVAAPKFVLNPLIDDCTLRYHVTHPDDRFSDAGIHRCEGRIFMTAQMGTVVVTLLLMGWSLRLRRRARASA